MLAFAKRHRLVPGLAGVGILLLLASQVWLAGLALGVSLALWVMGLLRLRGGKSAGLATDTAQVVAGTATSDGVGGAFSRLDPNWRHWLNREAEASRAASEQ